MPARVSTIEPGPGPGDRVERRLWKAIVASMALALGVALALLMLLTGGWNSPRPSGPPNWHAARLPLVLEAPPGETILHLLPWSGDSFTAEAVVNCLSGPSFNGIGLVFRAEGAEDYDVLAIGGDGYLAVLQYTGGTATSRLPWQQFPHVHRGHSENRLRLSCSGPTCRFYVNDEYAASLNYNPEVGYIGVWAMSPSSEPVTVAFTAVQVWGSGQSLPR